MPWRISIRRVQLAYADGMVLHTASSGAIPFLDELRLIALQDGAVAALGATRLNIGYLSGLAPAAIVAACLETAPRLPWHDGWDGFTMAMDRAAPNLAAPARMLFEMAAADGAARVAGQPLSAFLGSAFLGSAFSGGAVAQVSPTNQTLFLADDAALLARAEAYVARGFHDLKLRVGFGPFDDDRRRLRLLRDHFGAAIRLSADANGTWSQADAAANLQALAEFGLCYLEQPVSPGDWPAMARLCAGSPVPVMLDESLGDMASVAHLAKTRAAPLGHLKLAKLGGLDRLMHAGQQLAASGLGVMVGQMNEGVVSTLAAAHAAVALGVPFRELYGADGLANDPAGCLHYAGGCLTLPPGAGLGLQRHQPAGSLLWEHTA